MPRFRAPITTLASLAIVGVIVTGCGGSATTPTPSAAVASPRLGGPTLSFTVTGGPGAGAYTSDPASTLNYCLHAPDGSWRYMYGGGTPWTSVDLLFGARIAEPDGAGDVAAEISAGAGYLWMDQP